MKALVGKKRSEEQGNDVIAGREWGTEQAVQLIQKVMQKKKQKEAYNWRTEMIIIPFCTQSDGFDLWVVGCEWSEKPKTFRADCTKFWRSPAAFP
mmetsp:Transcript_46433/g.91632  ORF Transcript_46433/g.91632 Transcript_46433/m.91632 type:complete len:95 (+) Transcript_46433:2902-3186(+)